MTAADRKLKVHATSGFVVFDDVDEASDVTSDVTAFRLRHFYKQRQKYASLTL